MKTIILMILAGATRLALADGGNVGNGGDMCENRFQVIRNDIQSWLLLGGGAGLQLPVGMTFGTYTQSMLANISSAKLSCTDQTLKIGNAEKTCVNYSNSGAPYIVCNSSHFLNSSEENQYVLVHHEYAGLSGIEINQSEESDYRVSNQIGYFLEDQIIKKLVIKPPAPMESDPFHPSSCTGKQLSKNDIFGKIPLPNKTSKVIGKFQIFARKRICYGNSNCQQWKDISKVAQMRNLRYDYMSAGENSSVLSFENVFPSDIQFTGQVLAEYKTNDVFISFVGDQVQTESGYTYPSGNFKPAVTFGPYLETNQFEDSQAAHSLDLQMLGRIPTGPTGQLTPVKGRGLFAIREPNGSSLVPQMKFKLDSLTSHCARLTSSLTSTIYDESLNTVLEEFQFVFFGDITE